MYKKINCLNCGKIVTPKSGNQKYCFDINCLKEKKRLQGIKDRQGNIYYKKYYNKHKNEIIKYRKKYHLTLKYKFHKYKTNAKNRNIKFNLIYNDFKKYYKKPCQYCGVKIDVIGLDRIDSSKGYNLINIVPCCKLCNRMKWDLTKDVFIKQCKKIVNFR